MKIHFPYENKHSAIQAHHLSQQGFAISAVHNEHGHLFVEAFSNKEQDISEMNLQRFNVPFIAQNESETFLCADEMGYHINKDFNTTDFLSEIDDEYKFNDRIHDIGQAENEDEDEEDQEA